MFRIREYEEDIFRNVEDHRPLFSQFDGKTFFISGAAGLIGSYFIDLLVEANKHLGLNIHIFACDRNEELLKSRFPDEHNDVVTRVATDVCSAKISAVDVDYVIHAASNTSPYDYATKPVDTIRTNVEGTCRLCEFAIANGAKRFLLCSSVEAYGRNNGDVDDFTEDYSGYVDSNTVRANYPTSKRCAEAICNAYAAENPDFDFVIARIGRYYGPTVLREDNKAPTQFIKNAVANESIVLKSSGTQLYSWGYVGDCATGLLTMLIKGKKGNAYNVADPHDRRTLKEFATIAANAGNGQVEFEEQSAIEQSGYSKITKATMDVSKLESLGWRSRIHMDVGIPRTVRILRELWR